MKGQIGREIQGQFEAALCFYCKKPVYLIYVCKRQIVNENKKQIESKSNDKELEKRPRKTMALRLTVVMMDFM